MEKRISGFMVQNSALENSRSVQPLRTGDRDLAASQVGHFHTFGELGPTYEIIDALSSDTVRIKVLLSGETVDYYLRHVLLDPRVA